MAGLSGKSAEEPFVLDGSKLNTKLLCEGLCLQKHFDGKCIFHRCERCRLLQRSSRFQPSVNDNDTLSGEFGEEELKDA